MPNFENPNQTQENDELGHHFEIEGVAAIEAKAENPCGKYSVLFAPGWSRTIDAFKNSLDTLKKKDRDVISLDHRRKGGEIGDNQEKDLPAEVLRRAESLRKLIKHEKERSGAGIDIIAQSMGGMDSLVAAIMAEAEEPGSIKNIVLVNPAGMIGKDSALELGQRFIGQMKQNKDVTNDPARPESARENVKVAGKEFFKYVLANPVRAVKEILSMTNLEIKDLMIELKEMGIGISVIHGVDDLTFPMDRVQENTDTKQLDGFYSVKGGHNELYLNPEKYMAAAEEALTALRKKKEKPAQNI